MALLLESQGDARSPCDLRSSVHKSQEGSVCSYMSSTDLASLVFCRAGIVPQLEVGEFQKPELGEIILRELANGR